MKNAKTFPPTLAIPKFIQIIAQICASVSYKLASFFALQLFSRPISYTPPKREQMMLKSAKSTFIDVADKNKKIHVLTYGYATKKVLLVHGWCGRSTQLFRIADILLEKGYMVVSFDGPAHGKSSGKTTDLLEFINTIVAVSKHYEPFYGAIGHSFGAMALLNAQAKHNFFNKIITIGAADLVSDVIVNFTKNLGIPKHAKKLQQHIENKYRLNVNDFASSKAAESITCPVLVVHDSMDGDVAVSCAQSIRENLSKGEILITEKLGHTKILRNLEVCTQIVNFIENN